MIRSAHATHIREAELLLKIFKKHIDASYYSLAATTQENKFFWSYYLLKENYKKTTFWSRTDEKMSANEKAIDTLIEYYLQHKCEMECTLVTKEWDMLDKMITLFYERLHIVSPTQAAEAVAYPSYIGSMGIEG